MQCCKKRFSHPDHVIDIAPLKNLFKQFLLMLKLWHSIFANFIDWFLLGIIKVQIAYDPIDELDVDCILLT